MKVLGNRVLPTDYSRQLGRRAIAYIVLWGLGASLTSQSLLRRIPVEGFGTETSVISPSNSFHNLPNSMFSFFFKAIHWVQLALHVQGCNASHSTWAAYQAPFSWRKMDAFPPSNYQCSTAPQLRSPSLPSTVELLTGLVSHGSYAGSHSSSAFMGTMALSHTQVTFHSSLPQTLALKISLLPVQLCSLSLGRGGGDTGASVRPEYSSTD